MENPIAISEMMKNVSENQSLENTQKIVKNYSDKRLLSELEKCDNLVEWPNPIATPELKSSPKSNWK